MPDGLLRGLDPRRWPVSRPAAIRRFFRERGKRIVYFAGYSELGYEDRSVLEKAVQQTLDGRSSDSVIVHAGTLLRVGGEDGIAAVFEIAKCLGVETSGIHPSIAMQFHETHRVSTFCDHVFFVQDHGWGGMSEEGLHSPTLKLHLDVSDEMVLVGGGHHASHELQAFHDSGRFVRYVPANMNRHAAAEWCQRASIEMLDLQGAAYETWKALNRISDMP